MDTRVAPHLGQNILVVMDSVPSFLDALKTAIEYIPEINNKFFTLLCCHPTQYWEHSGSDRPDVKRAIEHISKAEDKGYELAANCLDQAQAMLEEAGVANSHIFTLTSIEDISLISATLRELKEHQYSGVIVSSYHADIVDRLMRKGITGMFRRFPDIEVLAIDTHEQRVQQTHRE